MRLVAQAAAEHSATMDRERLKPSAMPPARSRFARDLKPFRGSPLLAFAILLCAVIIISLMIMTN
jgi:hypothetical protein